MWGVWALLQHEISDIKFDYLDYAKKRFQRYYEDKQQLFDL
jgi:ethanolamine kinase